MFRSCFHNSLPRSCRTTLRYRIEGLPLHCWPFRRIPVSAPPSDPQTTSATRSQMMCLGTYFAAGKCCHSSAQTPSSIHSRPHPGLCPLWSRLGSLGTESHPTWAASSSRMSEVKKRPSCTRFCRHPGWRQSWCSKTHPGSWLCVWILRCWGLCGMNWLYRTKLVSSWRRTWNLRWILIS